MLIVLSCVLAIARTVTVSFSISCGVNEYRSFVLQCPWTNIELRSIEALPGTIGQPILFDLRTRRIRRGVLGICGTFPINNMLSNHTVR